MSLKSAIRRFSRLASVRNQSRARYILNIEKAKEKARKLEVKGQLDKAIRQYERVLEELDGKPELADELALFNKLGDLYVKQGNTTSAVDQYEKAITHYAEQGFPNNAIALCNKVLRNAPGRTHIYLKLAKLMMQRGFSSEAKQNLLEYAERMQKAGKLEDAFHALKEFADLSPDNEEIRLILADQLKKAARSDEAREQLEKLYHELQQSGDENKARATLERMRAIDPEYDLDAATPQANAKAQKQKTSDIVFLDLDEGISPVSAADLEEEVEPLDVEATSMETDVDELPPAEAEVDIELESVAFEEGADVETEAVAPIEGLDVGESFEGMEEPVEALAIEATSLDDALDVPEIEPVDELPDLEVSVPDDKIEEVELGVADEAMAGVVDAGGMDDLPMLDVPSPDADIEVIGLDEAEALEVEAPVPESVDGLPMLEVPTDEDAGLPMLEVPSPDEEVEVKGLDEAEEAVAATGDLPMLDVGPEEEDVEEIELEVPWDVEEGEPVVEVPDGGTPVFADESGIGVEIPDLDIDGVADLGVDVDTETVDEEEDLEAEVSFAIPEVVEFAPPDISTLEAAVADDPDLPAPHRELAEALIETGDRERGMQELDIALQIYQADGDKRRARDVLDEILRLDPNSVDHHQKRVEFATEEGDEAALVGAYLELADALLRSEELERARFVYERVLDKDPGNESAQIALETLVPESVEAEPEPAAVEELEISGVEESEPIEEEPEAVAVVDVVEQWEEEAEAEEELAVAEIEEPEAPEEIVVEAVEPEVVEEPESVEPEAPEPVAAAAEEPGGFVDLGALIMDEEEEKDTRMRISRGEPAVDEEEHDFAEMLSEFKKGIDANIDADDSQAHYDLGVAFKEMGLLDEAISEFQKALRGAEDRLRTSESLGLCFFEKGQFAVAATVLRRAVETEPGADDEKIGLLYWLGRCEEEQGRGKEALGYYQRIFSIDINFQDVSDRVNSLTQAGG